MDEKFILSGSRTEPATVNKSVIQNLLAVCLPITINDLETQGLIDIEIVVMESVSDLPSV